MEEGSDLLGAQDDLLHRSIPRAVSIEREDIPLHVQLELIQRKILEAEEIIEDGIDARQGHVLIRSFGGDVELDLKELLMELLAEILVSHRLPVLLGLIIEKVLQKLQSQSDLEEEKGES